MLNVFIYLSYHRKKHIVHSAATDIIICRNFITLSADNKASVFAKMQKVNKVTKYGFIKSKHKIKSQCNAMVCNIIAGIFFTAILLITFFSETYQMVSSFRYS